MKNVNSSNILCACDKVNGRYQSAVSAFMYYQNNKQTNGKQTFVRTKDRTVACVYVFMVATAQQQQLIAVNVQQVMKLIMIPFHRYAVTALRRTSPAHWRDMLPYRTPSPGLSNPLLIGEGREATFGCWMPRHSHGKCMTVHLIHRKR